MIPNSVLRAIADANAAMAFHVLLYVDFLAKNLLPDTAELDWLIRWANIFGVPIGSATYASGTANLSGVSGLPIPAGTQLTANATILFQTTEQVTLGSGPTPVPFVALTAGKTGLSVGSPLSLSLGLSGVNGAITIASFIDGVDADSESLVRANVLDHIRQPPMGGDAEDYVQWAKTYPGCTRAWCSPQEMGIGTVTLRFMMDDQNATSNPLTSGFPTPTDVAGMQKWIDARRPVTVLDAFVVAPIPEPINCSISNLLTTSSPVDPVDNSTIDASTMSNIIASLSSMLFSRGSPAYALNGVPQEAQTIAAVWVSDAILNAAGVISFDFTGVDHPMPTPGSIAVLGNVVLSP